MATADPYAPLKLENQLCYPIYLCAKEITQRYAPLLRRLDLTYTQYIVMMYFWEAGPSSQKDVSRALLLDPSTLTPLLRKLEAKGYISRKKSEADGRSLVLSLTEKGARLRDEALSVPEQMGCRIGLDMEEALAMRGLICKVLSNVRKDKERT